MHGFKERRAGSPVGRILRLAAWYVKNICLFSCLSSGPAQAGSTRCAPTPGISVHVRLGLRRGFGARRHADLEPGRDGRVLGSGRERCVDVTAGRARLGSKEELCVENDAIGGAVMHNSIESVLRGAGA